MLTLHSFPLLPRISIHRTCASGSVGFAPWTIAVPPAWINEDAHLCFRWQLSVSDWGWWWMWMGQEGRWVGGQKFLRDRKHQGKGRAYAESFWRLECSNGKYLANARMWWAQTELPGYFCCESTSDGHKKIIVISVKWSIFASMIWCEEYRYDAFFNKDVDDESNALLQRLSSQCNLGACRLVCTLVIKACPV